MSVERTTTPLTKHAAAFVAGLRYGDIPADVVRVVCDGVTDYAGVALLGFDQSPTQIVIASLDAFDAAAPSRLCFSRRRASEQQAALVNGVAAHALDYDDTGIGTHPAHPSAVLASAILAAGEAVGASGRRAVAAYVAGYEVWGDLARRETTPHHLAGWHPTAVFGAVAAAASVANLSRLDAATTAHALGIAASLAGGLVGNFGSMTKPLHAGRSAQSGVLAVRLARAGLTAAPDVLEKSSGFLVAYSPSGEPDLESPPIFGREWWIEKHGLNFKLYPVCYSIHRALDGLVCFLRDHAIAARSVTEIEVELTPAQRANLVQHDPKTGAEAKFSAEFAMASALATGGLRLDDLADDIVRRADIRAVMNRVRIVPIDLPRTGEDPNDHIRLRLADGRVLSIDLQIPRGHSLRPAGAEALRGKFMDCVKKSSARVEADTLFERLQALPDLGSLANLVGDDPGHALAKRRDAVA